MKPREDGDRAELIYGVHPILEALESGRRAIDRILVAREGGSRGLGLLLRSAREAGVPVTHVPREVLGRRAGARAIHQGVAAVVSAVPYVDAEEMCSRVASMPDGLLVALDGVEDPRNLGAVLRTAAAAGAGGVLLAADSTVGLTPAAAKTSAGAVERIPVAREGHFRRRLDSLRAAGVRVLGLTASSGVPWDRLPTISGPVAIVAGGEERGLRRGTAEACTERVTIPLAKGVESLNVSVAVAVILFEVVRRRRLGVEPGRS